MSSRKDSDADLARMKSEIKAMQDKYGEEKFLMPERQYMDEPDIEWRNGRPEFTRADYNFLKGKSQQHARGN